MDFHHRVRRGRRFTFRLYGDFMAIGNIFLHVRAGLPGEYVFLAIWQSGGGAEGGDGIGVLEAFYWTAKYFLSNKTFSPIACRSLLVIFFPPQRHREHREKRLCVRFVAEGKLFSAIWQFEGDAIGLLRCRWYQGSGDWGVGGRLYGREDTERRSQVLPPSTPS